MLGAGRWEVILFLAIFFTFFRALALKAEIGSMRIFGFGHYGIWNSDLFRISKFGFRAYRLFPAERQTLSQPSTIGRTFRQQRR